MLKPREKVRFRNLQRFFKNKIIAFANGRWNRTDIYQIKRDLELEKTSIFFSNISSDEKKMFNDKIIKEIEFLNKELSDSEKSAETYLWITNAGGLAGIFSVVSGSIKVDIIRNNLHILYPSIFFTISVILIGVIKASKIARCSYLRGEYNKDSIMFMKSSISLEELEKRYRNNKRKFGFIQIIAWICYFMFLLGFGFSAFSLMANK